MVAILEMKVDNCNADLELIRKQIEDLKIESDNASKNVEIITQQHKEQGDKLSYEEYYLQQEKDKSKLLIDKMDDLSKKLIDYDRKKRKIEEDIKVLNSKQQDIDKITSNNENEQNRTNNFIQDINNKMTNLKSELQTLGDKRKDLEDTLNDLRLKITSTHETLLAEKKVSQDLKTQTLQLTNKKKELENLLNIEDSNYKKNKRIRWKNE